MTPARLLAPAALVAAAVALFVVVSSGSGETESQSGSTATATPAATRTRTPDEPSPTPSGRTYTVKAGDTPSGIAAKLDVDVDELMAANPDADASALTVGSELEVP
jgi:LysM repeat protein